MQWRGKILDSNRVFIHINNSKPFNNSKSNAFPLDLEEKTFSHFNWEWDRVIFLPEVSFSNYKHIKQEQGHGRGDLAD